MKKRGGVLYVPAGVYKLTKELDVYEGIIILGDFKKPTEEDPTVSGTVLALYPQSCEDGNEKPFFSLRHSTSLNGLNFWYPEQNFSRGEPVKYPATVQTAVLPSTLENLNFVNSYFAINQEVKDDYTIQQLVRSVWGTPLHCGFWFDRAPDACRQISMDYRPDWWLYSGLPNVPDEKELRNWLYENAIAFDLGRIDWHFVGEITVRGYNIGVRIKEGFGRAYKLDIADCKTCIEFTGITYYGAQITACSLKAKGYAGVALKIAGGRDENGVSINGCYLESDGNALEINDRAIVSVQDSKIKAPNAVTLNNSRFAAVNTDFECDKIGSALQKNKLVLTNCRIFGVEITEGEQGIYTAVYNEENTNIRLNKATIDERDAARAVRYPTVSLERIVDASKYGLNNDFDDVASSLQAAIDAVYYAGGGVVYVPRGEYRIESPVTVKSGVELRGTTPYYHYNQGSTAYFITDYGKGDANAPALFTLESNSGLRGISVSYDKVRQNTICEYPPTIQGRGSDIFVIGVTVTACWIAADFASYRCDRHYIDGLVFAAFKTGIAVGSGSEDGVILNAHSNPGHIWDNPYTDRESWMTAWNGELQQYMFRNVTGFYVGESKNETIYMSFIFGTVRGVHIGDGAENFYLISHGIDFSSVGVYLEGKNSSVLIDTQLVGTWESGKDKSTAVTTAESFCGKLELYNLCPWNIHDSAVRISSGEINLNGGVFFESGDYAILSEGGKAVASGVIFLRRVKNDFVLMNDEAELCTFGNTHMLAPYALKEKNELHESDIQP